MRQAFSRWTGVVAATCLLALLERPGDAQVRGLAKSERLPALRIPSGASRLNPTGAPPLGATGRAPFNPTGPAPFDPTGPAPFNPTGATPFDPTGPPPLGATGSPPLGATGRTPFRPTGAPPFDPTGDPPFDATGPTPFDPTGDPPIDATGPTPFDPTGPPPLNATGAQFGRAEAFVDVVADRGAAESVARSFFCGAHGRGFASEDSFAAHLDRDHGLAFSAVSDSLVDEGGVWTLPAW